ncbi:MAG: Ig-like domain-containing protein [Thermoanaerobaculia bacterium]
MPIIRWVPAAALLSASLAVAPSALAQDASADATSDGASSDSGMPSTLPICPDAITTATGAVTFHRMGPVDFGPGTGMSSIGSHSGLGLDYNLLFSGQYDTEMRGHLNVDWPRALSITAIPEPNGGYLDVTFGLHMTATLWVAGTPIPIPLDVVIDDHEGHGRSMFTPWAWNYEGTNVHLNVSAWRTLYSTTFNVAGSDVNFDLQMRYNVDASIRTVEIGFPDRTSPALMQPNLSQITVDMPIALIPPPRDGNLDLLTRWKSQLRYQGSFEFRINPSCASSFDLTCRAATGLLGSVLGTISTPPLITTTDTLPDPFDNMPHYDLPVQQVDRNEIDFGDVHIGESVNDMFTITSAGRSTLAAEVVPSTQAEFTVGPGGCISAGGTLPVPVTFHPTSLGQFMTTITVRSNGTVGTPTQVVLVGRGVSTPTHRPVNMSDGGARSGDGSTEYLGPRIEAGCGCRTAGGESTGHTGTLLALSGIAAAVVSRRRRR